jgi:hypothetical protein
MNKGIRVEITASQRIAVVVGSDNEELQGIETLNAIRQGINDVVISFRDGSLGVQLNDGPFAKTEITNSPSCADPRIGVGYSDARKFDGHATLLMSRSTSDLRLLN